MSYTESDWHQIVRDLGPRLYRYFCGGFAPAKASDLVQETLLRLVQKERQGLISPALGTLGTYAFGIARFVRLEALKENHELDLVDDEKAFDVPSDNTFKDTHDAAHLRWAIRKLKLIEQEIILLMIDDEFSLDDIAANLNIPIGTVKSHVHRAKENLRKILEVKK